MRLLERTNRRVMLTPAGQIFQMRARLALEQAEAAVAEARMAMLGEAGTLILGFVSAALFSILPRLLTRFRQQIPGARIELEEMEPAAQLEALKAERLDLGLMHAEVRSRELETRLVSRERLIVAVPKSHPLARKARVPVRSLQQERILLPRRHEFPGLHDQIMLACQRAGFAPAELQYTRLLLTAVYLVSAGHGVALVPESFEMHRISGVAYRPLTGPAAMIDLVAVWRKSNQAPLLLRMKRELALLSSRRGGGKRLEVCPGNRNC